MTPAPVEQPRNPHICFTCQSHVDSVRRIGYKKCGVTNLLLNQNGEEIYKHIDRIGCSFNPSATHTSAPALEHMHEAFREQAEEWLSSFGGLSETSLAFAVDDFVKMARGAYTSAPEQQPCEYPELCSLLREQKAKAAKAQQRICKWIQDDDGTYQTDCGKAFQLINDDTLSENGFGYCIFCGALLQAGGK